MERGPPTPKSTLSQFDKTTSSEEALFRFFGGELQSCFPSSVNDQILFIRLLHSEGIDPWTTPKQSCVEIDHYLLIKLWCLISVKINKGLILYIYTGDMCGG